MWPDTETEEDFLNFSGVAATTAEACSSEDGLRDGRSPADILFGAGRFPCAHSRRALGPLEKSGDGRATEILNHDYYGAE